MNKYANIIHSPSNMTASSLFVIIHEYYKPMIFFYTNVVMIRPCHAIWLTLSLPSQFCSNSFTRNLAIAVAYIQLPLTSFRHSDIGIRDGVIVLDVYFMLEWGLSNRPKIKCINPHCRHCSSQCRFINVIYMILYMILNAMSQDDLYWHQFRWI